MRIKEFVDGELRDYVDYDNKRNIPHLMDGLKWSQRKALYAFIEHIPSGPIVVDKAGMRAAEKTHYAHGATSLIGVIMNMAANWPGSNNMNLLDPLGQFGTILDHEPSSERYIRTRLNDNYKKLFEVDDQHILIQQFVEGDEIEPEFYLPKLPLLLINGSMGTGNGFASSVLSYNLGDIKRSVQEVLKHGYVKGKLAPYLEGYKGKVEKDEKTNQVVFTGTLTIKNSTTIILTDLPPKRDRDNITKVLNKLVDDKIIKDYDDESTEDAWHIVVDCPRTTTAMEMDKLLKLFAMVERTTETLCVWLPNKTPRIFDSVEDLLAVWVEYRLKYYENRRLSVIDRAADRIRWLATKKKFIEWWNSDPEAWVKLRRDDLLIQIEEDVTDDIDFIERLLAIRITNLGVDHIEELNSQLAEEEIYKATIEGKTNKDLMLEEVKAIKI